MKGSLVFFKMFSSWQLFCSSARTISQLSVLTEKYSAWFYLWGNSLQATNMTNLRVLTLSLDCECAVIQNFLSWACALCCLTSTADCNSLGGCTATTTAQWLDMTPKNVIRRKKKVKLKFIWILKIADLTSGGSEISIFWKLKEKFDSGVVEVVEMQRIPFFARSKSYWYMLYFVPEMFANWWRVMTNL